MFPELLFDSLRQKNLQQLSAEGSFLERETVARQLLRDRACTLAHVAGRHVFQRCANDAEQIIPVMLIKFRVFDRNDCVDEIRRQLLVRNRLAVLHVNLAKDLAVPIQNDASGFHLFELV